MIYQSEMAYLYIAAMGRSGSTAFANMLTVPGQMRVLIEPSAAAFGFASYDLSSNLDDIRTYLNICASGRRDKISGERWGVKEVAPRAHLDAIKLLNPRWIVVLTRNIDDVYLSLTEKTYRNGPDDPHDSLWIHEYCINSSKSLVELDNRYNQDERYLLIRYEDFYSGNYDLDSLHKKLGLTLSGDQFANLHEYGRSYEISRNLNRSKNLYLSAADRDLDEAEMDRAREVALKCKQYQWHFGYSDKELL